MTTPRDVAAQLTGDRPTARRLARLAAAMGSTTAAVVWTSLDAEGRPRMSPLPWQVELGRLCDGFVSAVVAGTSPRETLSAPPRHGKTRWTGIGMPVRLLLVEPDRPMSILYVTASGERAEEVSAKVRGCVEEIYRLTGDQRYAPGRKWSVTEWETEGGHAWKGTGWSAPTGGIGCRALLTDDMIGTSQVYRSASTRRQIARVLEEDLLSRIMEGGGHWHMETRRGQQDTTAHIQAEYGDVYRHHVWRCWEPDRGYLWPERYGEAWRARSPHLSDTSPVWRSLYQQEPVPDGGTYIEPEWLTATYPETPEAAGKLGRVVLGVDLAFSSKASADACAFVVLSARGPYRDVLHVTRTRAGYVEQRRILRELVAAWRPDAIVVERAANGAAVVDELSGEIPRLRGESPGGRDKVARLSPHLPLLAARQLRLPDVPTSWARGFREELESFSGTDGEPDDQVDALVWALVAADTGTRAAPGIRRLAASLGVR